MRCRSPPPDHPGDRRGPPPPGYRGGPPPPPGRLIPSDRRSPPSDGPSLGEYHTAALILFYARIFFCFVWGVVNKTVIFCPEEEVFKPPVSHVQGPVEYKMCLDVAEPPNKHHKKTSTLS